MWPLRLVLRTQPRFGTRRHLAKPLSGSFGHAAVPWNRCRSKTCARNPMRRPSPIVLPRDQFGGNAKMRPFTLVQVA